ncbi:MAG: trp operon repressor [Spirochaetota bacterium]|nr:trp operon repressor [Spirochaetota bacterium]
MEEFARVLSRLNKKEIELFLGQILTQAERERIERRWELIRLLYEGVPQRTIASRLSISLCKVTRGSRELKRPDSVLSKILKRGCHLPRVSRKKS